MAEELSFRKQFVIGPRALMLADDWCTIEIASNLVLSHSPALAVRPVSAADGERFFLLGEAVSALRPRVDEDVLAACGDGVMRCTAFWAGRWALVGKRFCLTDAATLMPIYWRHENGEIWLSNNVATLGTRILGLPPLPRIDWQIKFQSGMSWIVNPLTARRGVSKLLPQRFIDPLTGVIATQGELPSEGPEKPEFLISVLAHWHASKPYIPTLSLTAGLDSRTILAAAVRTELDFNTCTLSTEELTDSDRRLPPKLSASAGFAHRLVKPLPLPESEVCRRLHAGREQMDNVINHPRWRNVAHGLLDQLGSMAHGAVFELGRCYYWDKLSSIDPLDAETLLERFFGRTRPEPYADWLEGVQIWLDTLSEQLPLKLDWRDRFYLDQRLGGWASHTQQSADLTSADFFYPANSLWYMKLMNDVPTGIRRSAAQRGLIRAMTPSLARVPVNPISMAAKIRKVRRGIRKRLFVAR